MNDSSPGRFSCPPRARFHHTQKRTIPRVLRPLVAGLLCAGLWAGGVTAQPADGAAQTKRLEAMREAAQELTYFNFDRAHEMFTRLRVEAEGEGERGEHWQKATLGLALAAHGRTPSSAALIDEAAALYRALAEPALASPQAPRALLQLGRIAEVRDYGGDVIDLPTAIDFYTRVYEGWPELDIADEAMLRHGAALAQQFKDADRVQEALTLMESWVGSREDRPMASSLYEMIGWVRLKMQDDATGALAAWVKADELGYIDASNIGQHYYLMGDLAEHRANDVDTAVRYYRKVILEAPRSGRGFEAQLGLRRLAEKHPQRDIQIPKLDLLGAAASSDPPPESPEATEPATPAPDTATETMP